MFSELKLNCIVLLILVQVQWVKSGLKLWLKQYMTPWWMQYNTLYCTVLHRTALHHQYQYHYHFHLSKSMFLVPFGYISFVIYFTTFLLKTNFTTTKQTFAHTIYKRCQCTIKTYVVFILIVNYSLVHWMDVKYHAVKCCAVHSSIIHCSELQCCAEQCNVLWFRLLHYNQGAILFNIYQKRSYKHFWSKSTLTLKCYALSFLAHKIQSIDRKRGEFQCSGFHSDWKFSKVLWRL